MNEPRTTIFRISASPGRANATFRFGQVQIGTEAFSETYIHQRMAMEATG
jgi:hypothetical protein